MKGISIVMASVACVGGAITAVAGGLIAASAAGLPMFMGIALIVLGLGIIALGVLSLM